VPIHVRGIARLVGFRFRRHHKTLQKIFEDPPPRDISWKKIVNLLGACGIEQRLAYGDGTMLSYKGFNYEVLHPVDDSPNPGTILKIREFLTRITVTPNHVNEFLRA
jgi:hypothetical protein